MSGWKFKERLKEHLCNIKFNRQITALARLNLQQVELNVSFTAVYGI